ncbi:MAG: hypothetical protein CMF50_02330 [Legionellales bacterium]|nr:hypothetical protein [Legionellales bacterium]|tara:strand:+ start:8986 stop:10827 length:1842 start_codon:yes stop_codon:yes gene_type:complete
MPKTAEPINDSTASQDSGEILLGTDRAPLLPAESETGYGATGDELPVVVRYAPGTSPGQCCSRFFNKKYAAIGVAGSVAIAAAGFSGVNSMDTAKNALPLYPWLPEEPTTYTALADNFLLVAAATWGVYQNAEHIKKCLSEASTSLKVFYWSVVLSCLISAVGAAFISAQNEPTQVRAAIFGAASMIYNSILMFFYGFVVTPQLVQLVAHRKKANAVGHFKTVGYDLSPFYSNKAYDKLRHLFRQQANHQDDLVSIRRGMSDIEKRLVDTLIGATIDTKSAKYPKLWPALNALASGLGVFGCAVFYSKILGAMLTLANDGMCLFDHTTFCETRDIADLEGYQYHFEIVAAIVLGLIAVFGFAIKSTQYIDAATKIVEHTSYATQWKNYLLSYVPFEGPLAKVFAAVPVSVFMVAAGWQLFFSGAGAAGIYQKWLENGIYASRLGLAEHVVVLTAIVAIVWFLAAAINTIAVNRLGWGALSGLSNAARRTAANCHPTGGHVDVESLAREILSDVNTMERTHYPRGTAMHELLNRISDWNKAGCDPAEIRGLFLELPGISENEVSALLTKYAAVLSTFENQTPSTTSAGDTVVEIGETYTASSQPAPRRFGCGLC